MKRYSSATYVVRWLFKWGFFKDDREAKEIIRRLEWVDGSFDKINIKFNGHMSYLDNMRRSQVKGKNMNRVGQEIIKETTNAKKTSD